MPRCEQMFTRKGDVIRRKIRVHLINARMGSINRRRVPEKCGLAPKQKNHTKNIIICSQFCTEMLKTCDKCNKLSLLSVITCDKKLRSVSVSVSVLVVCR